MINVEIKKRTETDEDGSKKQKSYLVINGIPDKGSFFSEGKIPYSYAHFYNEEVISLLTSYSFNEVGKTFTKFSFDIDEDWWDNSFDIDIYCNEYYDTKIPSIKVNLQFQEWEHWAKPWSMSSVAKQLEINIGELSNNKIKYWQDDEDSMLNGFGLEYFPANNSLAINEEVNTLINIVEILVNKTNKTLLSSIDRESVLTYFQFPDEIKTACKQYLVYFAQFIADMGILVDTELKEELNHTLFKIVPKDKTESLDKIREALNIYLNAPSHQNFQVQISNQNDIAAKQWEANVYHLKSQLSLAASIIQAKDSTIEMLQLSNYQYRQMLESHSQKKETDKEDVIKGIVAVKKYEGKGFSIDFAEIFRRLKRIVK
jgi:hypothetical protein